MANENGYVIYPPSIGKMDFDAAMEYAREWSRDNPNDDVRVEDCDTEKTLGRFRAGHEV